MYNIDRICRIIRSAREMKLENIAIADKYSLMELQTICNGVGPDFMPEKLRRLAGWIYRELENAALIHDLEYFEGGSREDFWASNRRLAVNGRIICRKLYAWYDFRRYRAQINAEKCAKLCDIFGYSAWNKGGRHE